MNLEKRIEKLENHRAHEDTRPEIIAIGSPGPDGTFIAGCRWILNRETGKYDYEEVNN